MPLVSQDLTLWQELVDQAHTYQQANQAFFQNCQDRLAILKKALHHPTQRKVALDFCCYLTLEERQSLLDDLVKLASVGHSDIEQVRQIILSLPQDWLLNNIENSANQVLEKATDEEYRRLLELYVKIHISITRRLIQQALNSDDPDICEVGQDFDDYLKKTPNYEHHPIGSILRFLITSTYLERTQSTPLVWSYPPTQNPNHSTKRKLPNNDNNRNRKWSFI
ncbi:MAG: hypothetical protein VKL42_23715 [Snowella sp.]|nr:hypothetical protein [Snowella sp.]